MKTIVQEYGPIYGEPVNGTVQGRPNGSVFVPATNTITIVLDDLYKYVRYTNGGTKLTICTADGNTAIPSDASPLYIAQAQDLASNIQAQIYSDDELTTLAAVRDWTAGIFNQRIGNYNDAIVGLTAGDTLYLRAQLMNNGVAVATSEVIEITMTELSP